MLNYTKNITLTGFSIIDNEQAEGYSATIKLDNPNDITFSSWQINKDLYKSNRTQCRKDAAEFEDTAYSIQDSMLLEQSETN